MATLNHGSSVYHSIQGLFCRNGSGKLLSVEDQASNLVSLHWSILFEQLASNETTSVSLPSGVQVETTTIELPCSDSSSLRTHRVREIYQEAKQCYVGLLSSQTTSGGEDDTAFRDWIENFFLLRTSLQPRVQHALASLQESSHQAAERITKLFETSIKNIAAVDEWSNSGRGYFFQRVLDFVLRNEPIQFGLPAFPCKSPNSSKVGGRRPDMAEKIALDVLHTFVRNIRETYTPGATLWIISDGHVFSDCIGVDDDLVSEYDNDLKALYHEMIDSPEDRTAIQFRGLNDIFFSEDDSTPTFSPSWLHKLEIPHPVHTKRSDEAELARKIMMASCQIDRGHLRELIRTQHPPTLRLFRGQSRFMLGDLATHDFQTKSVSQKKKLASSVASEMIARNQAYSNLIELLLPNFVRLSIHAHPNRGPKFGIRILPKDKVHAIDAIANRHELVPAYEFQLPTPWHNCIIKVDGDERLYLAKAAVAREAIRGGAYDGEWIDSSYGGHFALSRTQSTVSAPKQLKVPTVEKTLVMDVQKVEAVDYEKTEQEQRAAHLSQARSITLSTQFIKRIVHSTKSFLFNRSRRSKITAKAS